MILLLKSLFPSQAFLWLLAQANLLDKLKECPVKEFLINGLLHSYWRYTTSQCFLKFSFSWAQETFSIHDGEFKEGTHFFVGEKIGSGAFGECYKAYTSNDPSIFCVKKVRAVKWCLSLSFEREKRSSPLPWEKGWRVGLTFNLKP